MPRKTKKYQKGGFLEGISNFFSSVGQKTKDAADSANNGIGNLMSSASSGVNNLGDNISKMSTGVVNSVQSSTNSVLSPNNANINQNQNVNPMSNSNPILNTSPINNNSSGAANSVVQTAGKNKSRRRKMRGGRGLGLTYYASPVSGLKVVKPTYWIGGKKTRKNKTNRKRRRY